ncbi:MAG: hypothetical protein RLZZ476_1407, partial [Verrucomicrobiota bacterium]|jgi:hypothetical protein
MAFPTSVNSQITDAVTQANTQVLGDAPAIAMAAMTETLASAAHNVKLAQQQASIAAQAATTMGVTNLYSMDTASEATATAAAMAALR